MNLSEQFEAQNAQDIARQGLDEELVRKSRAWMVDSSHYNYTYHFTWLGRPVIQFPQDLLAVQEVIWKVRPDLIVETGIAHGGSLIFHASLLELIGGAGRVLGIDIDIRPHNRVEIERHPMAKRIDMLQGSSIDPTMAEDVRRRARGFENVLVILDSNHTHAHVLQELCLYAPLVTNGSYLIVFDTSIEDAPEGLFQDRPWGKGNNPKTAVWEFLKTSDRFEIDKQIEHKLLITVAPDGYLRCIKD